MTLDMKSYMDSNAPAGMLPEPEARLFAANLQECVGMEIYPRSIAAGRRSLFFLAKEGNSKHLGVISGDDAILRQFTGETAPLTVAGEERIFIVCPASPGNAAALRTALPWLAPRTLGLSPSAGCGDRLGIATPGHVRAIRRYSLAPIFAQQSMRENARTGRTPQQVMDEALWGVFQEGWHNGFGADADHLKTTTDIDLCAAAGYTFFTFDPGEHVDNAANTAPTRLLAQLADNLPWEFLASSPNDLISRLCGKTMDLGTFAITLVPEDVLRAAAKYGKAVAHTVTMYRHLSQVMSERPFELEMSVDETETVTSLPEHIYIAVELKRLGVRWVSLAPRYVGSFEKGVDYIGDIAAFEESFARHVAVARAFGPYKLSLHSGSDKFSIYPVAARLAGKLVHLKTAGTSYLEAVRAVAAIEPALFREILSLAVVRYPIDRASYHVSAEIGKVPDAAGCSDAELPHILENFHARQVLHVTFGSLLQQADLRSRFLEALIRHEETHYGMIEKHFMKHLSPFSTAP